MKTISRKQIVRDVTWIVNDLGGAPQTRELSEAACLCEYLRDSLDQAEFLVRLRAMLEDNYKLASIPDVDLTIGQWRLETLFQTVVTIFQKNSYEVIVE